MSIVSSPDKNPFTVLSNLKQFLSTAIPDEKMKDNARSQVDQAISCIGESFLETVRKIAIDTVEERERKKIVVLSGFPEEVSGTPSQRNNADLLAMRNLADKLHVNGTLYGTERLGRPSADPRNKPRLLKIFFFQSSQAMAFLSAFRPFKQQNVAFRRVFARLSQSSEERAREFELRQQARELSKTEKQHYVVYSGAIYRQRSVSRVIRERRSKAKNIDPGCDALPQQPSLSNSATAKNTTSTHQASGSKTTQGRGRPRKRSGSVIARVPYKLRSVSRSNSQNPRDFLMPKPPPSTSNPEGSLNIKDPVSFPQLQ